MKNTGIRTWEVTAPDFPVGVRIVAQNEPSCRAVPSDLQVVKDGALARTIPVVVADDPANLAIGYSIPSPGVAAPCEIVGVVHCWFDDNVPDNAKYKITIAATSGDTASTSVGVPTINPGVAVLVFQSR